MSLVAAQPLDTLMAPGCSPSTWLAVMWPLVATWTMAIDTDPGYGRIMDSDVALGNSPDPDVTMVPGAMHGPLQVTRTSMDLAASWPFDTWPFMAPGGDPDHKLMTTGATGVNTGHLGCSRALDQDLALGYSPGPDIFLDSGNQLGH